MSKKAKIKSIELQVGDTTIKLSPEDAKALHEQLNELFGQRSPRINVWPTYVERSRPYWDRWVWGSGTSISTGTLELSDNARLICETEPINMSVAGGPDKEKTDYESLGMVKSWVES